MVEEFVNHISMKQIVQGVVTECEQLKDFQPQENGTEINENFFINSSPQKE